MGSALGADLGLLHVTDPVQRPMERSWAYDGSGLCFVEMGDGVVGRVDVHFRADGWPTAPMLGPGAEYAAEKAQFGAVRRARWFDL